MLTPVISYLHQPSSARKLLGSKPFLKKSVQKMQSTQTSWWLNQSIWKICSWPKWIISPKYRWKLHPGRLTWTIIMEVWKIIFLYKWVICRFHVNLPGCKKINHHLAKHHPPRMIWLKSPLPRRKPRLASSRHGHEDRRYRLRMRVSSPQGPSWGYPWDKVGCHDSF